MTREEKKQARIERLRNLAANARKESTELFVKSSKMADVIPFGQPIHIGHYSERSDRRYRNKIHETMGKSVKAGEKAEYYEQKAKAAENNNSIYLGDDDAVERLEKKLADLEKKQETMKETNRIIRSKKLSEIEKYNKLIELGYTEDGVRDVFTPNFIGEIGFPRYSITNNGANIRRVKEQLERAKQMKSTDDKEYTIGEVRIVENYEENRLQLFFPGKPEDDIRSKLKHNGFRWAPSNGCWQSYLNRSQIERAKSIIK